MTEFHPGVGDKPDRLLYVCKDSALRIISPLTARALTSVIPQLDFAPVIDFSYGTSGVPMQQVDGYTHTFARTYVALRAYTYMYAHTHTCTRSYNHTEACVGLHNTQKRDIGA